MFAYETFRLPYEGVNVVEPLTANAELDDLLWLLDQCGFDEHVRAMPHKDIFFSMRQHLLGKEYKWRNGIQHEILKNFIHVEDYDFTPHSGHDIAKHLLLCLWRSIHGDYIKANLIDHKINMIAQGSPPVYPVRAMALPKEVTTEGSRIALLLMLKIPEGFIDDYRFWAQKQALYEHLHHLNPNHTFVKERLDENTSHFQSLYRNANRRKSMTRRHRRSNYSDLEGFYKNLHKYKYSKKCSIIRCLLEAELAV